MIYVRYLVFIFFISGEHLFIYHVFMKIEIFTDEAPNEVSRELWLTCNCFLLLSHTSVLFLFLFVIYSHTSGFCYCFVGREIHVTIYLFLGLVNRIETLLREYLYISFVRVFSMYFTSPPVMLLFCL